VNTNGPFEKTRAVGTSRDFEPAGKEAMDYNVEGFTITPKRSQRQSRTEGVDIEFETDMDSEPRVRYTAVVKGGDLGGMIHQAHTTSTMYAYSTILIGSSNLELICTKQYISTNTD
jgi:hypothetical protein